MPWSLSSSQRSSEPARNAISATASALTGASRESAYWLTVPSASGPNTTPATM